MALSREEPPEDPQRLARFLTSVRTTGVERTSFVGAGRLRGINWVGLIIENAETAART